jgi:hypothetical protein
MTAPGDTTLLMTLLAVFTACTGYAAGRLHQWYRMGHDRDEAFRDGYDTATRSVFSMAARVINPRRDRAAISASARVDWTVSAGPPAVPVTPAAPVPPDAAVGAQPGGRHTVPDELVQAPTYRLAPDRVARARVRGAAASGGTGEAPAVAQAASRVTVPKPRSS